MIPRGVTGKDFFFLFPFFFTASYVEMRKCAKLMEIRSYCCLTEATFAVIASVINLWDERRQASPSLWWLRAALKNCCYEWHSGLMNMNTFIKIGTGSPLSADWEWQSHWLGMADERGSRCPWRLRMSQWSDEQPAQTHHTQSSVQAHATASFKASGFNKKKSKKIKKTLFTNWP